MPDNVGRILEALGAGMIALALGAIGWLVRRILTNQEEIAQGRQANAMMREALTDLTERIERDTSVRAEQRREDREYWKSMSADIRALRDRQEHHGARPGSGFSGG